VRRSGKFGFWCGPFPNVNTCVTEPGPPESHQIFQLEPKTYVAPRHLFYTSIIVKNFLLIIVALNNCA
jgi:hypothetical protein